VDVHVKDALSGAKSRIHDRTESLGREPALGRDMRGDAHEATEKGLVGLRRVGERRDVAGGNYEHVVGSLRGDIVEGNDVVVTIDDRSGNTAGNDLTEDTVVHSVALTL